MKKLTLLLTALATLLLMPALTACGNDDEPEMPGFPAGPFNGTIYIQETQETKAIPISHTHLLTRVFANPTFPHWMWVRKRKSMFLFISSIANLRNTSHHLVLSITTYQ